MRTCALALAVLLTTVVWVHADRPGPVAAYDFNDGSATTATDVSGHGHDANITGASPIDYAGGKALWFDGTGGATLGGDLRDLQVQGDLTIEAWVKSEDNQHRDMVILADSAGLAIKRNYNLEADRGFLYFEHGDGLGSTEVLTSDKAVLDGSWQHVALVAEYPYLYLYLNGEEIKSQHMGFDITPTEGGPRMLGGWWAGHFKGGLDDVRLYRRALSPDEIRAHFLRVEQPTPVPVRISLSPRYLFGSRQIVVAVAVRGEVPSHVKAVLTLADKSGRALAQPLQTQATPSRTGSGRMNLELRLPAAALQATQCVLKVALSSPDGSFSRSAERAWDLPPIPSWLGSKEGLDDRIPPPYTPLKVAHAGSLLSVSPWGRRYDLQALPFPAQIATRGQEVLAAPARLVARVAGKEIPWQAAPLQVVAQTPGRVRTSHRASAAGLRLAAETSLEYDGFLRVDWSVRAQTPTRLDSLTFELPLDARYAQLFYDYPYQDSLVQDQKPGTLDRNPTAQETGAERVLFHSGFRPIVWLGDNDRGLSWFCESYQGWSSARPDQVLEIVRRGPQVILRLHVMDVPTDLKPTDRPLSFSFALQATPVKPVERDCWDYRFGSAMNYGKEYRLLTAKIGDQTEIDYLSSCGVRTLLLANWTDVLCYPYPVGHEQDLRDLVKAAHQRGMKVICYHGYQISELAPEWPALGQEVVVLPSMRNPDRYPDEEPQMVDTVCLRSVWQDRLVDGIARLIDEFDIDGVYLDSTNMSFMCANRDHGCGYTEASGRGAGSYPLFPTRETFRRLYKVVKSRKPDGIVDSHVYSCMNSSALAYTTSFWNGEQLPSPAQGYIPDALPLDLFRTIFTGRQWGSAADFLHYRVVATYAAGYPQALSETLLHDVLTRPGMDRSMFDLAARLWKLSDDFGRKQAQFLPYWENAGLAQCSQPDVYVSLYKHPTNGVLAVVSNLGRQEATAEVRLDLAKLGLAGQTLTARDGLDRQPLDVNDGLVKLTLPSLGFKLVWLK